MMNPKIFQQLSDICKQVHFSAEGQIVNQMVLDADANNLRNNLHHYNMSLDHAVVGISRYTLTYLLAVLLFLNYIFRENKPYPFMLIPVLMVLSMVLTLRFGRVSEYFPGQETVLKLSLSKEVFQQQQLQIQHHRSILQSQSYGLLSTRRLFSGLGFFDRDLDVAMNNPKINYFEHDASLRAIFGIQNKAYDCVSLSAISIIKII